MESLPRFRPRKLLRRLVEGQVDFVVVGGFAAVVHGSPRLTNDLDICCSSTQANLAALGKVLTELGASLRGVEEAVPFLPDLATLRRTQLLTLESPDGPMDLLAAPSGSPGYASLRRQADRVELDRVTVLVASLDHLMDMKRAAGRPKDLVDLEELQAVARRRKRSAGGGEVG